MFVIEDDSLIIGTEQLDFADVAETTDGRFDIDNDIPGAVQWAIDNDPNFDNWTDEGPFGWTQDNSDLIEGGSDEYHAACSWLFRPL